MSFFKDSLNCFHKTLIFFHNLKVLLNFQKRYNTWLSILGIKAAPSQYDSVCSKHFEDSDIMKTIFPEGGKKFLKKLQNLKLNFELKHPLNFSDKMGRKCKLNLKKDAVPKLNLQKPGDSEVR